MVHVSILPADAGSGAGERTAAEVCDLDPAAIVEHLAPEELTRLIASHPPTAAALATADPGRRAALLVPLVLARSSAIAGPGVAVAVVVAGAPTEVVAEALAAAIPDAPSRPLADPHPVDAVAAVAPAVELRLATGVRFDDVMARLAASPDAPSPFAEPDAFLRWCGEAEIGGHAPIPRYFAELRRGRHDLLVAYPEVPGRDAGGFCEWIPWRGYDERGLAPDALGPLPVPSPRAVPDYAQAGVNLVGLFNAELGVGEVARRVAVALRAAHVPYASIVHRTTGVGTRDEYVDLPARFDVNVVCLNADSLPGFVQEVGPAFVDDRPTAGVWFWETSTFPSMFHSSFRNVDELWVTSGYLADVLRTVAPVPVRTLPLPIVAPDQDARFDATTIGVPNGRPYLLCSFDHLSIPARKNPRAAIRAFCEAFEPDDGPVLVVKSVRGDQRPDERDAVRAEARGRPDVVFADGYLDAAANAALLAGATAFVSLHRSEGYGLNLADALALGTPLVATAATGNLEFCSPEDTWLVPAVPCRVGEGHFPYEPDATWFEPDHAAAVDALRAIVADPVAARARAAHARTRVLTTWSAERCGRVWRDHVAALRAAHPPTAPGATGAPAPALGRSVRDRLVSRTRGWRR